MPTKRKPPKPPAKTTGIRDRIREQPRPGGRSAGQPEETTMTEQERRERLGEARAYYEANVLRPLFAQFREELRIDRDVDGEVFLWPQTGARIDPSRVIVEKKGKRR